MHENEAEPMPIRCIDWRLEDHMGMRQGLAIELPAVGGTYVLVLGSQRLSTIEVGRMSAMPMRIGYYLYVGSAFGSGGIRARVGHHLRASPRPHWHIDYLRRHAQPVAIWYQAHRDRQEHLWAAALRAGRAIEIAWPGFGSSDCHCVTHLFFASEQPDIKTFRRRLARRVLG